MVKLNSTTDCERGNLYCDNRKSLDKVAFLLYIDIVHCFFCENVVAKYVSQLSCTIEKVMIYSKSNMLANYTL